MLFDGCARSFRQPVAQGIVAQESCKRRHRLEHGHRQAFRMGRWPCSRTAGRPAGRGICAGSSHATPRARGRWPDAGPRGRQASGRHRRTAGAPSRAACRRDGWPRSARIRARTAYDGATRRPPPPPRPCLRARCRPSAPVAPALSRARPFGHRPDLCWFFQRVSPYKMDNISIIHHHFPAVRTLQRSIAMNSNFPFGPRGIAATCSTLTFTPGTRNRNLSTSARPSASGNPSAVTTRSTNSPSPRYALRPGAGRGPEKCGPGVR